MQVMLSRLFLQGMANPETLNPFTSKHSDNQFDAQSPEITKAQEECTLP